MKNHTNMLKCPPTRWTLVTCAAGDRAEETSAAALNELLRLYQPVLRTYAQARMGIKLDEAEDVAQNFVMQRILEKNLLAQADREKGRFRNFLLKAYSNYVLSQIRRAQAKKRGPSESKKISLDEDPNLICHESDIEKAFNVAWSRQTISEALRRMQKECRGKGRVDVWKIFWCRILLPALEGSAPASYADLIERFGFRSPSEASNVLITAKRMFIRTLEGVVRDTVADESQIESEMRELKRILLSSGAGSYALPGSSSWRVETDQQVSL